MLVSPQLLAEYEEVLNRNNVMKFTHLSPQENAQYIQEVSDRAYLTSGALTVNVIEKDPDDNIVLACAEEGIATHVVTKNIKDFPPEHKGIKVVTPVEFLRLLERDKGE